MISDEQFPGYPNPKPQLIQLPEISPTSFFTDFHTCHILPPSEIDLGLCLAVFAGSGGKYLFHRIGWKGRIWQLWLWKTILFQDHATISATTSATVRLRVVLNRTRIHKKLSQFSSEVFTEVVLSEIVDFMRDPLCESLRLTDSFEPVRR